MKSRDGMKFANNRVLWYCIAMSKRILAVCLAAALTLPMLAGCGREETSPEPMETETVTETTTESYDPYAGMVEVDNGAGGTVWIEKSEILNVFALDRNAIAVSGDNAYYNGTGWRMAKGIDVSGYQGDVDWQAVAEAGIEFALLRCGWRGYGSGDIGEDEQFKTNLSAAREAGLDVGVYFFSQAVSVMEAAEEAVFVASLLEGEELQLPVFFDWENVSYDEARTDGMDGELLTDCALEFCHLLETEGYDTGIYTNLHLAYNYYDLDALADQVIWLADPGDCPAYYYEHEFWQYSFDGTVDGIDGAVDLDVRFVAAEAAVPAEASVTETTIPEAADGAVQQTTRTEETGEDTGQ